MDNFIRRFLGIDRNLPQDHPNGKFRSSDNLDQDDLFMDRGSFFGPQRGGLDDMFEHFHRDMFQQMESLHRQMEDMMKGFGATDFPSDFSPPAVEPNDRGSENSDSNIFFWSSPSPFFRLGPDSAKKSPREFMLKEDDEKKNANPETILPRSPKNKDRHMFDTPRWTRPGPEKLEDTDLDGKISDENVLAMIKRPSKDNRADLSPQSPSERPRQSFSSQSVSISSYMGPDGKVEQRKVFRDSSGREESTHTRSIGDKSYTVTTITDDTGSQEKHEKLHNMDEGDLNKFKDLWSKPKQDTQPSAADSLLSPHPSPHSPTDASDQSLFFRLFGRGSR